MQHKDCLFTVFTPTYNRSETLLRVHKSLKNQTLKDFEWLIIDDGSTDDTEQRIKEWQLEADFSIRYVFQQNSGKHVAFNRAVSLAKGKFFVPLDSDDACVSNALERLYSLWLEIPEERKFEFSGVCVHCQDQNGFLVGKKFIKDKLDSDSCEMFYRYRLVGEKWGFHRTEILKDFPFPEITGVKFIPESIVWHAIAKQYKIRFVNEALRIYYQDNPLNDSLTHASKKYSQFKARQLYYQWVLENDIEWVFRRPFVFFKYAFQWVYFSKILRQDSVSELFKVKSKISKFLIGMVYLPAMLGSYLKGKA